MTTHDPLEQRVRVVQAAPASIDEVRAPFHLRRRFGVDYVARLREQWNVQAYDVRAGKQVFECNVVHAERKTRWIRLHVVAQQVATEAMHNRGKDRTDLACADDPNRAAEDVADHQPR